MDDSQSNMPPVSIEQHLELAALHLYECCREWSKVDLPAFDDADVEDMRRDAKYRALGAHRRGIQSVRLVTIERIAERLAAAFGHTWPECANGLALDLRPVEYLAICATRRQHYRHIAVRLVAEVFRYTEQGADLEPQRQMILDATRQQRADDTVTVTRWRDGREAAKAVRS